MQTLNTLCGRFLREGEVVPNPGVISPERPFMAQANPPNPAWGKGEPSRVRGLGEVFGEMPTAALSDEIITPGEGRVRALMSVGGNPVGAWPDQLKTIEAMKQLDLNVSIDVKLVADGEDGGLRDRAEALARASRPDGADGLVVPGAVRALHAGHGRGRGRRDGGVGVLLGPGAPDGLGDQAARAARMPDGREALHRRRAGPDHGQTRASRSTEVREAVDGGAIFEGEPKCAWPPKAAGTDARLDVAPPDLVEEIAEVRAQPIVEGAGYLPGEEFSHRLISRRMREFYNSSGRDIAGLTARDGGTNPAFMNPRRRGRVGDRGRRGHRDRVEPGDHSWRRGLHRRCALGGHLDGALVGRCPGDGPATSASIGGSTNRLVNNEEAYDPITGMARQSAIPVNIRPAREPVGAS